MGERPASETNSPRRAVPCQRRKRTLSRRHAQRLTRRHRMPVISGVPFGTCPDHRTFQRQARVSAFALGPGDEIEIASGRRRGLGVRAEHQYRQSRLRAQFHFISHQGLQSAFAHDEENEFRHLDADLQTERRRTDCVERRAAPAVAGAGEQDPVAAFATDEEAALYQLRYHEHSLRRLKQLRGVAELRVVLRFRHRGISAPDQFRLFRRRPRLEGGKGRARQDDGSGGHARASREMTPAYCYITHLILLLYGDWSRSLTSAKGTFVVLTNLKRAPGQVADHSLTSATSAHVAPRNGSPCYRHS